MSPKQNRWLVGNKIIRLGPVCIKRYGVHKRLPNIPAVVRLERETIGAKLLSSQHLIVARPRVWSERGIWAIRCWYSGVHPDDCHRPTGSDRHALANWLSEHRGRGNSVPFQTNINLAIITHFSMLGIQSQDDPLMSAVLSGDDLLHADLVPENILLGSNKPVILDPESVSVGHIAWDVAQIIANILRASEDDPIAVEFLYNVSLSEIEKKLVWRLVKLFMNIRN